MYISKEILNEIQSRLSIREIISSYVNVIRKGRDYWCICPFHNDKNPSMKINEERGTYYCFGCKESGNIFTFIMKIESMTFYEAVVFLAEKCGIEIKQESEKEKALNIEKNNILKLYQILNTRYVNNLKQHSDPDSKRAYDYIKKRGFTDETIEEYKIGWASSDYKFIENVCKENDIPLTILKKSGLFSSQGNPYFVSRITFPIINAKNQVIAFSARTLSDDKNIPKYINSSESVIFQKKNEFFGLHSAISDIKKGISPVICEGNFDVISINSAGYKSAVATLGTALTDNHALYLRRFINSVKLFFDSDNAGVLATLKAILILNKNGLSSSVVRLSSKMAKDANELLQKNGKEALLSIINNTQDSFEFVLEYISQKYDISTVNGKNSAIKEIYPYINTLSSNIEKQERCKEAAEYFNISINSFIDDFNIKKKSENDSDEKKKSINLQHHNTDNESIFKTINEYPFYETDLIKHLCFSRDLFLKSDIQRKIKYQNFTNQKAAYIYSLLVEKIFTVDISNNDAFLDSIEDEEAKKYLSQSRYEAEEFASLDEETKLNDIEEAINRMLMKKLKDDIDLIQKSFSLGADTTLSTGYEALREKLNSEMLYKKLEYKMRGVIWNQDLKKFAKN